MEASAFSQQTSPDAATQRGTNLGTQEQLAMMELVFEITRRFASLLDLGEVLAEVLSLTVNTLGADRGSIFLFDDDKRVTRHILARRNLPAKESEQVVSAVLDKGLAGWAIKHRQVALVHDTLTDGRWHHFPGDELETRSAIAVPLLYRGKLNGLLTLMHSEPRAFSTAHLDMMTSIAGQAAIAVENARLFTHVRDERAVLEALINGVHDPIIVTDSQNAVRYTNPAARALDEHLEDAVGQLIEQVLPSEKLGQMFHQLLTLEVPQRDEVSWPDGRTFDAHLAVVPGVGSVAVLHDVTHFKELDRMKSEFVATVSHDLKSPLTVIYGYVELLKEALPEPTELATKSLEEIRSSAARMKDLITTLLDLAQIESGLDRANRPCQIRKIISNVVEMHCLQAEEKKVALKVVVPEDLPFVNGHPLRLSQAVSNLMGNALKYTPAGGEVTVAVRVNGPKLIVRVSDTGPGIPLAKQAGLFGKFYKVGAQETLGQEGHGLGLAIVKSVVEAHDGQVWVESKVGEGSTFAFSLPLVLDQA